jgi:hypothetical protein
LGVADHHCPFSATRPTIDDAADPVTVIDVDAAVAERACALIGTLAVDPGHIETRPAPLC